MKYFINYGGLVAKKKLGIIKPKQIQELPIDMEQTLSIDRIISKPQTVINPKSHSLNYRSVLPPIGQTIQYTSIAVGEFVLYEQEQYLVISSDNQHYMIYNSNGLKKILKSDNKITIISEQNKKQMDYFLKEISKNIMKHIHKLYLIFKLNKDKNIQMTPILSYFANYLIKFYNNYNENFYSNFDKDYNEHFTLLENTQQTLTTSNETILEGTLGL